MKLIILDRDGVINEDSDNYIRSVDEFIPLPGSIEAMARLTHAGYSVTIATNQSGIARGYFDIHTLNMMHEKLHRLLAAQGGQVDGIFYCPHGPEDHCACRKPKPGLLQDIQSRFDIDLNDVYVVGDSLRDLEAARAVGARPVLVRTGKGERTLAKGKGLDGIPVYADLAAFVDELLQQEH
ncbi:MAG: D-glycero-beta-D-manno-heptose 1,7-bisphosphate 7-phosphatase [Gammaproteobacteria bacterium]|nr:D-glycero-beta-D-manno-heptose 1,7-bisphosphate 7-phosphatase [Gammaproteobacteria bacterium]MDH5650678.1 D-glycero-beta-D-manno-heptose 1,7-bisphosphate 7-phosphatase [Gammaproteobacteria bacterium]